MNSKEKDLEIVYNLKWKNGPNKGDKKNVSFVVLYDLPTITMHFEVFKNYLLKNSGVTGNDVKVSLLMENGREYAIQSQVDFQTVLYQIRRRARAGAIITLLLERISEQPNHKNLRHSNDVETQSELIELHQSSSSSNSAKNKIENPPEWFQSGLNQFKNELKTELISSVSTIVADAVTELKNILKQPAASVSPSAVQTTSAALNSLRALGKLSKKSSSRSHHHHHNADNFIDEAKDVLKLQNKLQKLERKPTKCRDKNRDKPRDKRNVLLKHHPSPRSNENATKSSDSDEGNNLRHKVKLDTANSNNWIEDYLEMDAQSTKEQIRIPVLTGGETYLHEWEVQNTGKVPWTVDTQLSYSWGSKRFSPGEKTLAVPFLQPGEIGKIRVKFQIPKQSGQYESYWRFMHRGKKFGNWLGVQVIVNDFFIKESEVAYQLAPAPSYEKFISLLDDSNSYNNKELIKNDSSIKEESEHGWYRRFIKEELNNKETSNDSGKKEEHTWFTFRKDDQKKNTSDIKNLKLIQEDSQGNSGWQRRFIKEEGLNNREISSTDEEIDISNSNSEHANGSAANSTAKNEWILLNSAKNLPEMAIEVESEVKEKKVVDKQSSTIEQVEKITENNLTRSNNEENAACGNSIKFSDEDLDNIVVITVPKDEQVKEGFIYVNVDGNKILIPKNILKPEVVNAANELEIERSQSVASSVGVIIDVNDCETDSVVASPVMNKETAEKSESIIPQQENAVDLTTTSKEIQVEDGIDGCSYFDANNYMTQSHCSAAGSCFSEINNMDERFKRLFVFPQDVPGYEVVNPSVPIDVPENFLEPELLIPDAETLTAVPNYQQTPPDLRQLAAEEVHAASAAAYLETACAAAEIHEDTPMDRISNNAATNSAGNNAETEIHILPETLINGAASAATSAMNTARSVFNMIKPQRPGNWVNGHWISNNPKTPREANLQSLAEMGFWNRDLNATLLARFNDDLNRVVAELVQ